MVKVKNILYMSDVLIKDVVHDTARDKYFVVCTDSTKWEIDKADYDRLMKERSK